MSILTLSSRSVDVAVLGGGFSGLSAALRLADRERSVLVVEQRANLGGLARSFQVDGFSVEAFYHHYFTTDQEVVSLARRLGLEDHWKERQVTQGIYCSGRLLPFSTPLDLLRFDLIPFLERIRLGLVTQKLWGARGALGGVSVSDWVRRAIGERAERNLFEPLIRAKFGISGSEISAAFARGRLSARGASRGAFRWHERLAYLQGGSEILADRICKEIEKSGMEVWTSASVKEIANYQGKYRVVVETEKGRRTIEARDVVCTLPTPVLDRAAVGFPESFLKPLREIEYLAVVVVTFGLTRPLGKNYWISVSDEKVPFNALIEHTQLHPRENYNGQHIVYAGRYLRVGDEVWSLSDSEVAELFLSGLQTVFPALSEREVLWNRVARDSYASPIFKVGYGEVLAGLSSALPRFHLAGTLMVYPDSRNVNSALRIGREVSDRILSDEH